jgi:hypothetical protein
MLAEQQCPTPPSDGVPVGGVSKLAHVALGADTEARPTTLRHRCDVVCIQDTFKLGTYTAQMILFW